jgi:acetyl-CoA C-acetyltransferase
MQKRDVVIVSGARTAVGCTGARITYSLAMQLRKRDLHLGLATLCIGGGQGMAIVLERV